MALKALTPIKPELVEINIETLGDTVFLRKLLIRDKVRLQSMVSPYGEKLSMLHLKAATLAVSLCDESGVHLYDGIDIDEFFQYFTTEQLDELYVAYLTVNPAKSLEDKKK